MFQAVDPALKEKARALYYQGLKWKDIAAHTGLKESSLKVWGSREKWVTTKQALATDRFNELNGVPSAIPVECDVQNESKKIRVSLIKELNSQLAALEREPVRKAAELSGRDGRAAVVRAIVDSAKTVLGWDSESGKNLVQVNILANGSVNLEQSKPA